MLLRSGCGGFQRRVRLEDREGEGKGKEGGVCGVELERKTNPSLIEIPPPVPVTQPRV